MIIELRKVVFNNTTQIENKTNGLVWDKSIIRISREARELAKGILNNEKREAI